MLEIDGQTKLDFNGQHEFYTKLIPNNHNYRLLLQLTNFDFILEELKDNYC